MTDSNKQKMHPYERTEPLLFSIDGNTMCTVWTMPVSWEPPVIVSAIGKNRYTHSLLVVARMVRIGVIHYEMMESAIQDFGRKSGRDGVKPLMDGYCSQILEGPITDIQDVGDHSLVFIEVRCWE